MLKRKAYKKLLEWKEKSAGKTVLLVNGARRIGKSFLCREFAKNEYKSHIIVDFANIPISYNYRFCKYTKRNSYFIWGRKL